MNQKHTEQHKQRREDALSRGEKTYYGPACSFNHNSPRFVSSKACVRCTQIKAKDRYQRKTLTEKKDYSENQNLRQSRDPRYRLYHAAKHRACARGRDFTISMDDIVVPETCPVLGIPMDSPSLDRFDNRKGYTPDNIRVISTRANVLKSDASVEELIKILQYMTGGNS